MKLRILTGIVLLLASLFIFGPLRVKFKENKIVFKNESNKVFNQELEDARRLWNERKTADYDFVIHRLYAFYYSRVPVLIRVRDDAAVSIEPNEPRGELSLMDGYEDFETVEKMFDEIQDAFDYDFPLIEVTYNKENGFPEKMRLDSGDSNHSMMIIEIQRFEIVKID